MMPIHWKRGDRADLLLAGGIVAVHIREVRKDTIVVASLRGLELEVPRSRLMLPALPPDEVR